MALEIKARETELTNSKAKLKDIKKIKEYLNEFKQFYEKMNGEAMSQESEEIIQQLLEEVSEDDAH